MHEYDILAPLLAVATGFYALISKKLLNNFFEKLLFFSNFTIAIVILIITSTYPQWMLNRFLYGFALSIFIIIASGDAYCKK